MTILPTMITFSDPGPVANGTRFMRVGTASATTTERLSPCARPSRLIRLDFSLGESPGGYTVTAVLRKNGVDTDLSCTLSGMDMHTFSQLAVDFLPDDAYSIAIVRSGSGGPAPADAMVTVSLY